MTDDGSVLWIGGPPGSGKTSVARLVARRHGVRWYNADAHTWEHRDRAVAAGHPVAIRWEAMSPAERWSAPAGEMLAMSLHGERGRMVADDVRALPRSPLTIAEGTPVTPEIAGATAVWLLPGLDVLRARLEERGASKGHLTLYLALAEKIEAQVTAYGGRILEAEGDVRETAGEVERIFAAALGEGPVATTRAQRRALLRYANQAAVDQHLAFFARPWAHGDARASVFEFACECADHGCEALVELRIGDFPTGALLAPGHHAQAVF